MGIRAWLSGAIKPKPYNMQQLLLRLEDIRRQHDHVAICPEPTGGNWLGIYNATRQLFPDSYLAIPQSYSNQVLTDKDLLQLCDRILELNFKNLVINGHPLYFGKIINRCSTGAGLKIGLLLHGTFSEMGYGIRATEPMRQVLRFLQQDKIHKVGAVRRDVAEFIALNWKYTSINFMYKCDVDQAFATSQGNKEGFIKIGVLGSNNFNKNTHNQVCGALLVPNSQVYVGDAANYSYLGSDRVIGVGRKDWREFVQTLGAMDINLHISFSESWGQITTESLAMGVPCLVAPSTNVLDEDMWLREMLTVNKLDSPAAISASIERVLANRSEIVVRGISYIQQLNEKADRLIQEFLAI